jgi:hypothetical protein
MTLQELALSSKIGTIAIKKWRDIEFRLEKLTNTVYSVDRHRNGCCFAGTGGINVYYATVEFETLPEDVK